MANQKCFNKQKFKEASDAFLHSMSQAEDKKKRSKDKEFIKDILQNIIVQSEIALDFIIN